MADTPPLSMDRFQTTLGCTRARQAFAMQAAMHTLRVTHDCN